MYDRNRRRPSTEPCGTPDNTEAVSDSVPLTTTAIDIYLQSILLKPVDDVPVKTKRAHL